jgi:hypothetical protein
MTVYESYEVILSWPKLYKRDHFNTSLMQFDLAIILVITSSVAAFPLPTPQVGMGVGGVGMNPMMNGVGGVGMNTMMNPMMNMMAMSSMMMNGGLGMMGMGRMM